MAIYNEILVGRYNRALQKLLGMKGPASMNQLAGELITVFNLFYGTENRYLESWDRYAVENEQTAGAGNTAFLRIRNPTNSGVVAVIEKCELNMSTQDVVTWQIGTATADLASVVANVRNNLDFRNQRLNPALINSSTTGATALNVIGKYTVAVTGKDLILTDNQELPLLPGDAIQFQNTAVALTLRANLIWRERVMEESELK